MFKTAELDLIRIRIWLELDFMSVRLDEIDKAVGNYEFEDTKKVSWQFLTFVD